MVFDGSGPLVKRCNGFDGSLWSSSANITRARTMLTRDDVEYEMDEEVDNKFKDDTMGGFNRDNVGGFNDCCLPRCQLPGMFSQSFTGDDGDGEEGEEDVDDDKNDNMVVLVVAVFHRRHGASYLECPHRISLVMMVRRRRGRRALMTKMTIWLL